MKTKRLMKSHQNRMLTGVLGGIADYFGWNARYLRIGYLVVTLLLIKTLIPVLLYLLLMALMPSDYGTSTTTFSYHYENATAHQAKPSQDRKILHDVKEATNKEEDH